MSDATKTPTEEVLSRFTEAKELLKRAMDLIGNTTPVPGLVLRPELVELCRELSKSFLDVEAYANDAQHLVMKEKKV